MLKTEKTNLENQTSDTDQNTYISQIIDLETEDQTAQEFVVTNLTESTQTASVPFLINGPKTAPTRKDSTNSLFSRYIENSRAAIQDHDLNSDTGQDNSNTIYQNENLSEELNMSVEEIADMAESALVEDIDILDDGECDSLDSLRLFCSSLNFEKLFEHKKLKVTG